MPKRTMTGRGGGDMEAMVCSVHPRFQAGPLFSLISHPIIPSFFLWFSPLASQLLVSSGLSLRSWDQACVCASSDFGRLYRR